MNDLFLTLYPKDGYVLLSPSILDAIGHPKHIQMLTNADEKNIMIRACGMEDDQAIVVPGVPCEIGARPLLKTCRSLGGWEDDFPRVCCGELSAEQQAVRFSLMDAAAAG